MSVWEGSNSPTCKGPHETLQDAAVQWITSESHFGSTTGTFQVHSNGSIDGVPTFSYAVTIDPGAFELHRDGGELVDLQVTTSVVGGKNVAVLTFVGPDLIGGSLADRSYTLTAWLARKFRALARIVAVANAYDAMTSDTTYRAGMWSEHAFDEIKRMSGSQFDPEAASAFLKIRKRIVRQMYVPVKVPGYLPLGR